MSSLANTVFKSFIREVLAGKSKHYFNSKGVIQSSVGLIFRIASKDKLTDISQILSSSYDRIELLFTQRAGYEKDKNAYNIVFPGGQCDGQENDLETCKRQLYEEIKLKVDEQCIYVGQLPKNFYYMEKRGKKVFISCHVWCMKQEEAKWKETLSKDELRDSKWVQYADLLKDENYVEADSIRLGIIERMSSRFKLAERVGQHIKSVKLPQLNLGMDRNLWGLTLWIWSFTLQMALRNLKDDQSRQKISGVDLSNIRKWISHMKKMQVDFKDNYIFKYPIIGAVQLWHIVYRVSPFTYERQSETNAKITIVFIMLFLSIIYAFAM